MFYHVISNQTNKKHHMVFFLSVIFRSLNSDLDEISISVGGGVKIQLAFGDISNETTDVVVNTTGFTDFETGRQEIQEVGKYIIILLS